MAPTVYRSPTYTGISTPPSSDMFGPLGHIYAVTIHHSAGPRAGGTSSQAHERAKALHRSYQSYHIGKGWGDIGYHWSMDDYGRYYRLRPIENKGAHVGGWNTGNVGIMLHGNYVHDTLTRAQRSSLRWLFRGGFHFLTGATERQISLVRGHREWPGHGSNDCPGTNLLRHLIYLRNRETY